MAGFSTTFFFFARFVIFRRPITAFDATVALVWTLFVAGVASAIWLKATGSA